MLLHREWNCSSLGSNAVEHGSDRGVSLVLEAIHRTQPYNTSPFPAMLYPTLPYLTLPYPERDLGSEVVRGGAIAHLAQEKQRPPMTLQQDYA